MPTMKWRLHHPQVTGSVSKKLYERLVEFKKERKLKSISQALVVVLQEYFDLRTNEFSSVPDEICNDKERKIEALEQRMTSVERALEEDKIRDYAQSALLANRLQEESGSELPPMLSWPDLYSGGRITTAYPQSGVSSEKGYRFLANQPNSSAIQKPAFDQTQNLSQIIDLRAGKENLSDSYALTSSQNNAESCETLESLKPIIEEIRKKYIEKLNNVKALKAHLEKFESDVISLSKSMALDSSLEQSHKLEENSESEDVREALESYRQGRFREAIAIFSRVLSSNRTDSHSYYCRGLIQSEIGDFQEALADFNEANSLNPEFPFIHYSRGIVYRNLGCVTPALENFQHAQSLFENVGNSQMLRQVKSEIEKLQPKQIPPSE